MHLERADGVFCTVEELKQDVEAAKRKFSYREYCFTYITVESLIIKVQELERQLTGTNPNVIPAGPVPREDRHDN